MIVTPSIAYYDLFHYIWVIFTSYDDVEYRLSHCSSFAWYNL